MTCAVRNAAKHEHSKHFARKVDAQQWLDPATTSVQTGSYVDRRLAEVTVAESAPTWFATKVDLTPTTRRTHDIFVRVHIVPRCGALPLCDVTHGRYR